MAVTRGTDAAVATIQISPANATLTVTDGQPQTQAYTATLVAVDGTMTDVTADATFTIADSTFGSFTGTTATVSGGNAGVTQVQASAQGATGSTPLTVITHASRVEGSAPANAESIFGSATQATTGGPTLVYPADGVLAPPNLGAFDVHWTDTTHNVWAVEIAGEYADLTIYTTGQAGGSFWTATTPTEWATLAGSKSELTLTVTGLNTATPTTKATSATQHIEVTNEQMAGGVYYWTTTSPQGIFRYDMTNPAVAPAPYFPAGQEPGRAGNCMGCHTLSTDGTKLALTIDSGDGRGTIYNVADMTVLVPFATNPQYWNFATFNADASKLVTVENGILSLRTTAGGAVIATVPSSPGKFASHPEFSPDGTWFADVETPTQGEDFVVTSGSITVRSFDNSTNTFGTITTLLADGVGGYGSYYPTFSPDGKWLLVTRVPDADGSSYQNPDSSVWVLKADGTMPPIMLTLADGTAGQTDSWARWAPFGLTTAASGEPLYFITFSSGRAFGVRLPLGSEDDGEPQTQIWMAPFYPDKAMAGMDPSGPALRIPFQEVTTSNHIAQWTQQVVTIQ